MAREVIIRIKDDLDSNLEADKTIPFGYNGTHYEIDLTAAHADEFEADMARWIKAGRLVIPEKPARKSSKRKGDMRGRFVKPEDQPGYDQRQRVRAWAKEVGYEIYEKGQISADIVTAYAKTHPDEEILPSTWPVNKSQRGSRTRRRQTYESVVAQDGSEQSVSQLFKDRREQGIRAAATARQLALESGRFSLPRELRDKIRLWAIGHNIDQAPVGQLKTEAVNKYFEAHPHERRH